MSMNKFVLTLAVSLWLAGCGSSVNLNDVPVEDRAIPSGASASSERSVSGQVADGSAVAKGTGLPPTPELSKAALMDGNARVIYFEYDSFVVTPEYQALVEAHARLLKADARLKVVIEGHTVERGGREYNLALGQRRAESVRRALGLLGVADPQVEAVSFGEEKPAVAGSSEAAWVKNRRAEITYR
jgi:peptidoglycan-associated lipoprotein